MNKKLLICNKCGRCNGGVNIDTVTKPIHSKHVFTVERGGAKRNDFPTTRSYRDMFCPCGLGAFEAPDVLLIADEETVERLGLTDDLTAAAIRFIIEREEIDETKLSIAERNQLKIDSMNLEDSDELSCRYCGRKYNYAMHLATHEKKCKDK